MEPSCTVTPNDLKRDCGAGYLQTSSHKLRICRQFLQMGQGSNQFGTQGWQAHSSKANLPKRMKSARRFQAGSRWLACRKQLKEFLRRKRCVRYKGPEFFKRQPSKKNLVQTTALVVASAQDLSKLVFLENSGNFWSAPALAPSLHVCCLNGCWEKLRAITGGGSCSIERDRSIPCFCQFLQTKCCHCSTCLNLFFASLPSVCCLELRICLVCMDPSLEKDWQSSEWQNKNIQKCWRSANKFCSCSVEDLKFVCSKTPGSMLGNAYRIGGWLFTFVEDAVLTWSLLLHSAWIRMRSLVGWRLARCCPSQLSFKVLTSLIMLLYKIVGAMVVIAEVYCYQLFSSIILFC